MMISSSFTGYQLSSIAFTSNTVILSFDGPQIIFENYPVISVNGHDLMEGDLKYIDVFCGFLTKVVHDIEQLLDKISIDFEDSSVLEIYINVTSINIKY